MAMLFKQLNMRGVYLNIDEKLCTVYCHERRNAFFDQMRGRSGFPKQKKFRIDLESEHEVIVAKLEFYFPLFAIARSLGFLFTELNDIFDVKLQLLKSWKNAHPRIF